MHPIQIFTYELRNDIPYQKKIIVLAEVELIKYKFSNLNIQCKAFNLY